MVKNKGFLPSGPSEIPVQRNQMKEIIYSLLPACRDPDLDSGIAFKADAIIANPPAYGKVLTFNSVIMFQIVLSIFYSQILFAFFLLYHGSYILFLISFSFKYVHWKLIMLDPCHICRLCLVLVTFS